MTVAELEAVVWRYEAAYFALLPTDDPAVRRYRELLARKDVGSLRCEWASLARRFENLEPIEDPRDGSRLGEYYPRHAVYVAELARRAQRS